jgi:hypothetical protein
MAKSIPSRSRSAASQRSVRKVTRRQNNRLIWILGAIVAIGLVAYAIYALMQSASQGEPGQFVAIQSRDHIAVGATHPAYNSDPPAGGWHYDTPALPNVYDQPLADEQVVHNLEHGYIVISYDCSKLTNCDPVKSELRKVFTDNNGWKIVVAPRQNRDPNDAIGLTAWGRVLQLPSFDRRQIDAFIAAYRDKGPEQTPN